MALSATASQGFEPYRETNGMDELLWVPGVPGVTYDRGDMVSIPAAGEGVPALFVDGDFAIATVAKRIICSANTNGFPKVGKNGTNAWGDIEDGSINALVPLIPLGPRGTQVHRCTFANQTDDENITSYTASTRAIVTAAVAADDDPNGALLYVYGGPGAGQWNVVIDATATSNTIIVQRQFDTALTAASDIIYLAGAAGDNSGISFFKKLDLVDHDTLEVADGATDGDMLVFMGAQEVGDMLGKLMLPVIRSSLIYHA